MLARRIMHVIAQPCCQRLEGSYNSWYIRSFGLYFFSHQPNNHMNMGRHDDIFINPHIGIPLFQCQQLLPCNGSRFCQTDLSRQDSGERNRVISNTNRHMIITWQAVVVVFQPGMLSFRLHRISSAKLTPGVSSSTFSSSATVAAISQKPTRVPRFTGLTFGPATMRGTYSRVWSVVAV